MSCYLLFIFLLLLFIFFFLRKKYFCFGKFGYKQSFILFDRLFHPPRPPIDAETRRRLGGRSPHQLVKALHVKDKARHATGGSGDDVFHPFFIAARKLKLFFLQFNFFFCSLIFFFNDFFFRIQQQTRHTSKGWWGDYILRPGILATRTLKISIFFREIIFI